MSDPGASYFAGRDSARLAYREVGEGRPLVLLHGFAVDASMWLRYGWVETIAAGGHRVIMPDFRGHGSSAKPHDLASYPPDVLSDDVFALVAHLGLDDYDLAGYSLGARVVVRMLARGAAPGRAVVAGQGLVEVLGGGGGTDAFVRRVFAGWGTFAQGSREWLAEQWLWSNRADPTALLRVLDSIVPTPAEALDRIQVPTLVVAGAEDERAASVDRLAAVLPRGCRAVVPGDHGAASSAPELAAAIAEFLAGR
ncbi:alpha/beta fold hydrolase [Streptomyces sp. T028]|uniref:alpha/beta fold hydrolase n=1 Tax=Streptomyces sp. T028 TaxID=3394379 RepID=UPI003A8375B6